MKYTVKKIDPENSDLSKFFWAVKTFGGLVNVDAFCRIYEMNPQGRKVTFEYDEHVYTAQSGCCSFHPRRANKVQKIVCEASWRCWEWSYHVKALASERPRWRYGYQVCEQASDSVWRSIGILGIV